MVFKKLLPSLIFTLLSFNSISQLLVSVNKLKLTEEFGQIYKSPTGIEIGYFAAYLNSRYQFSVSLGYYFSQAKEDEYLSYGLLSDGIETTFIPSKQVYRNFRVFPMRFGGTYNFQEKPFSPYVSLHAAAYFGSFKLETNGGSSDDGNNVEFQGIGLNPEFGVFYTFADSIQIRLGVGKLLSIPIVGEKMQYWKIGLTALFDI